MSAKRVKRVLFALGRIAANEGRFNSNTEVIINTEVKSIPVTKKGVYFAFRDQGACISLLAIKVYYISCPEVSVNFAHFSATPTGREVALIEQTLGICVINAIKIEQPTFLCKGDGKWYLPSGGCHCKPGHQADIDKQECKECPIGKFKHEAGLQTCELCPKHSKAPDYGFTECRCDTGYYRSPTDPKKMPCTRTYTVYKVFYLNSLLKLSIWISQININENLLIFPSQGWRKKKQSMSCWCFDRQCFPLQNSTSISLFRFSRCEKVHVLATSFSAD